MNYISVIVPYYYNDKTKPLADVCKLLSKQDFPGNRYEIIVVENPVKTDYVRNICSKYNCIHISSETGANAARNTGIKKSKGNIIALCDSDMAMKKDWLSAIDAHFSSADADNTGICGGRVIPLFQVRRPVWLQGEFLKYLSIVDYGDSVRWNDNMDTRHLVSANCAFTRDVWVETGGFDESIGLSGSNMEGNDEVEFFNNSIKNGRYMYYNSAMIGYHLIDEARTQFNWFRKRFYMQGRSDAKLAMKKSSDTGDLYHNNLYYDSHITRLYNHDINQNTRDAIAHEPTMRDYIKKNIICRTDYITGFQNQILGISHWTQLFR